MLIVFGTTNEGERERPHATKRGFFSQGLREIMPVNALPASQERQWGTSHGGDHGQLKTTSCLACSSVDIASVTELQSTRGSYCNPAHGIRDVFLPKYLKGHRKPKVTAGYFFVCPSRSCKSIPRQQIITALRCASSSDFGRGEKECAAALQTPRRWCVCSANANFPKKERI